jgi:hypothetical protein
VEMPAHSHERDRQAALSLWAYAVSNGQVPFAMEPFEDISLG